MRLPDDCICSPQSVRAQSRIPDIQNTRRITYAGAWTNYGFHEDGFTSGLKLAVEQFGAKIPFAIQPADRSIKVDRVSRTVVSGIESLRAVVVASPLWSVLVWGVLIVLGVAQRLSLILGLGRASEEIRAVRSFWQNKDQVQGERKRQ